MAGESENEYKLLASVLLLEKEDRAKIFSAVRDDYFAGEQTREMYQSFRRIFEKYPDADESAFISSIDEKLRTFLIAAMNSMMSPGIAKHNLDDTLGVFREQYIRRKKSQLLTELLIPDEITAADIHKAADDVQELCEENKINSGQEYLLHYNDEIKTVPTGFKNLDAVLGGGFFTGTLVTIGARPSTGKTTFAINIASHNPGRKILFVSIEMTAGMIYDRLVADQLMMNYSLASRHKLSLESVKAVIDTFPELIVVDNISGVEKIAELIYSTRPDIAIIDFMQIIASEKRFVDNRQRIDYISQTLKRAAKATGSCIITLSQITRSGKDKPTMSDLKESGGLEQDSDYVLILHRPYVNDKTNDDIKPSQTTVTLDKNKFGNTQEFSYEFDGVFQHFSEVEKKKEAEFVRPSKSKEEIDDDLPF